MSSVISKLLHDQSYRSLRQSTGPQPESPDDGAGHGRLFDSICSMQGLRAGWDRVAQRSPLAGGDGIDVAHWRGGLGESALEERLGLLSASLMSGSYRPGPVRRFVVPKKRGGGTRTLGLPCVADRVVQSAALIVLDPLFEAEFEESSFGYRHGRSVKAAAERISALYRQGFHHVVEADILSYFDNVPHGALLDDLEDLLPEPPLIALFSRWLDMAGLGNTGLLQGAPISPLLANLYLDRLDEAVADHGAHIVRFADDFVILTKSREAAERELTQVIALLRDRGLILNPAKTRINSFDHGFDFLGRRFLKGFILDGRGSADEEDWDAALADALPQEMTPGQEHSPHPARQFRNADLAVPVALPSSPIPQPSSARVRPIAPRQRALHLYGKGRRLNCRDNCFSVEEGGEEIWLCGADRLDRIDVGPNAEVSDAALRFALATNTLITFVDGRGMVQGRVEPEGVGRAALHRAQAHHAVDPALNLVLAKCFVAGKIANQRTICQRWRNNSLKSLRAGAGSPARHYVIAQGVEERLSRLAQLVRKAGAAPNIPALLGAEGEGSKIGLQILRLTLKGWTMDRRQRRPAPDAVNAVLNFLSYLLAREVEIAVRRRGLHSGFSHLHAVEDGRASLAFDLMEELRAPLVEAQALALFNTGALQPGHFFAPDEGNQRIWMTPEGSKKLIGWQEGIMEAERLVHPDVDGKTGWRGVIDAQLGRLVDHYEGSASYKPYAAKA